MARARKKSHQRRAKPIACIPNGPLLNFRLSSATRPRLRVLWPSRSMRITLQKRVRCVDTPRMSNRPRKGLLFVCQNLKCGYTLHADLIGARHVTLRTLLVRQDWARTGCLSTIPDASDREAKAARLQEVRLSLRWSPEVTTSLRSLTGDR